MAYYSYEREQERLRKMIEEVFAEDDTPSIYDDASDSDESCHEEQQLDDSGTEQEISDSEESEISNTNTSSYVGKNKTTLWRKHVEAPKTVKTRKENLIKRLPGPTLATKLLKRPLEIWNYFVSDDMINLIVQNTNIYIRSVAEKFARDRDAKQTNPIEIRAFCGLLYLAGIYRANRLNAEDLWRTDGSGIELFRLSISLQRFRFLVRCLRFDNIETRAERRSVDKLAPIREIFDRFVSNCMNGYNHSEFVTVDEMLAAFRGKCAFLQYIPSKPDKYGLKILALCDAKMFYTSKMEVYVGSQPDGPYKLSNSAHDVVLRLCGDIFGSGRNVTMDNWFTGIPLIEKLLIDHRLTVIGTIRKNKRELPLEFTKPVERPPRTSMFGFGRNCTLVSYVPKKKKNVLVVSSMHHYDDIDLETGDLNKPVIITAYNHTKGGVDVVDRLCANYNCARNTRRWPMTIFYKILNIAGINSQIIHSANNPNIEILRRNYLRELVNELIMPHLKVRAAMSNLPRTLTCRLQDLCQIAPSAQHVPQNVSNPGRCAFCDWKKNRKTRFSCVKCAKYMCLEYIKAICEICLENNVDQE